MNNAFLVILMIKQLLNAITITFTIKIYSLRSNQIESINLVDIGLFNKYLYKLL